MHVSAQTTFKALASLSLASALAQPMKGSFTELDSFAVPRSPSGLFFDADQSSLLYVLCGTQTNGDHDLFAFTTDGVQQCRIQIPQAVGMSRVDGFYITHGNNKAYIVDSQGPVFASEAGRLGGSVYEVEWTDPCGCADGTCSETSVEWNPTVTNQWSLTAQNVSSTEGGGVDEYFRNSGIVVVDDSFFAVNGVHPIDGSLQQSYPKSIVQIDTQSSSVLESWSFDATTVGRDVDMEGLACGPDRCQSSLFVGDEYNYIYQLDLASGRVTTEWDLRDVVNVERDDKGIEALTYAPTTGYFYAGIQDTARIHVVHLDGVDPSAALSQASQEEGDFYDTPLEDMDPSEALSQASLEEGDFYDMTSSSSSSQGRLVLQAVCASIVTVVLVALPW